jgi:hypothetical protein
MRCSARARDLAAVLQGLEVSESTVDRWRVQYGGMRGQLPASAAIEIIPRRAVLVRFPGGTTLEIFDNRIDLVRFAIDRMTHEAVSASLRFCPNAYLVHPCSFEKRVYVFGGQDIAHQSSCR